MKHQKHQQVKISKPWVIIHELEKEDALQVILAGPSGGASSTAFVICTADLIRHIANAFGESSAAIAEKVMKEVLRADNPSLQTVHRTLDA